MNVFFRRDEEETYERFSTADFSVEFERTLTHFKRSASRRQHFFVSLTRFLLIFAASFLALFITYRVFYTSEAGDATMSSSEAVVQMEVNANQTVNTVISPNRTSAAVGERLAPSSVEADVAEASALVGTIFWSTTSALAFAVCLTITSHYFIRNLLES